MNLVYFNLTRWLDACEDNHLLGQGEFVALAQFVFQVEGRSAAF